jgi:hypothetical protein
MVEKKNCKRGGELDSGIFMFILEKLRVTHVQLAVYIYIFSYSMNYVISFVHSSVRLLV